MKKPVTYETRYRHKLNMLEPGTAMLKWAGIFLLTGLAFHFFSLRALSFIAFGISGTLAAALVLLLMIEAHQDQVLNTIASREERQDRRVSPFSQERGKS